MLWRNSVRFNKFREKAARSLARSFAEASLLATGPSQRPSFPNPLRLLRQSLAVFALILGVSFSATPASAVKIEELKADKNLTPERLIKYFADFDFNLGREVRHPQVFLEKKAGDCDDFATLAADLLRERGYTTRLVVVYMPKDVHVVCYVAEINGYLDYNRRKNESPLIKCGSELADVASSVAASFRTDWRSVSEFSFKNGTRDFLQTEFR